MRNKRQMPIWEAEAYHDDSRFSMLDGEPDQKARQRLASDYQTALRATGNPRHADLADILSSCSPGDRCGDGACPQCFAPVSRQFRQALEDEFGGEGELIIATVIPTDPALAPMRLEDVSMRQLNAWLTETLRLAGMSSAPIIGGWDVSHNTVTAMGGRPHQHWVPHACLFTAGRVPKLITKALREVLQPTPMVPKPVKTELVSVTANVARSYGLKHVFEAKAYRIETSKAGWAKAKLVSGGYMRPDHALMPALLWHLHRKGFKRRIISRNVLYAGP